MTPLPQIFTKSVLLMLLFACFGAGSLQAANMGELKQRMKERVAQIDALKASGEVGESNRGYLVPRQSLSEAESELVAAENNDRRVVYTYLAKRAGATVEKVEKQRAADITKHSARGVWLQDAEGKWYQK